MDAGNLARVFGPTIVGHSVPNPDPMTILQDTKRQPKVSPAQSSIRAIRFVWNQKVEALLSVLRWWSGCCPCRRTTGASL